jgi:hypothetical protein
MAEKRYVVFRPDPTEGWCVQPEIFDKKKGWVEDPEAEAHTFSDDGKFSEAHDWALTQHPGMDVFVPMGNYVQGMTVEEDVANQEMAGRTAEEVPQ